jgi:hypothetical protein
MKHLVSAIAALCLSGCIASGPLYQDAPPPVAGKALIYVYRVRGLAFGLRQTWFYVDDVEVGELDGQGYTWAYVPAGVHRLKQEWPIDVTFGRTTDLVVNWEAGKTYYYRLETGIGYRKIIWKIARIRPEMAEAELASYHLQPARNSDITTVGTPH